MKPIDEQRAALELVVEVLRAGTAQTIVARGGSMTPAIADGARVTLAPLSRRRSGNKRARTAAPPIGRAPGLRDVVAVTTPTGLVVHRVVGVDARGAVLVKGDACPRPDGWFAPNDVVAIVASVDGRAPGPPRALPPRWRRAVDRLVAAARALAGVGTEGSSTAR